MTHSATLSATASAPSYISKHRVEALADGLFAIVMTLLVLELKVPELPHHTTSGELWAAMQGMWRVVFSFVMTFTLSAMFWMVQQTILTATHQIDRAGTRLHLLTLMFVSVLPFSTAMLGHYINNNFAMSLYFGNQTMIAAILCIAWLREKKHHNLGEMAPEEELRITARVVGMVGVLLGACIAAAIAPQFAFFGALPAIVGRRVYERKIRRAR